jgi:hypothetical protein
MIKFKQTKYTNSFELNQSKLREMLNLKSKYNLSGIEFKALVNILTEIPHKPDNLSLCEDIYLEILIRKFLDKETTKWTFDKLYSALINEFKMPDSDLIYEFIIESYNEFKTIFKQNNIKYNNADFYCFMYKIISGFKPNDSQCVYPFLYISLNSCLID